ncbi:MAG: LysM peptidoglycan-binding domain-containing protein, partial [Candidatus Korobacteraceae bacterium]
IPQEMRTYWRYHRVEYGDSLGTIARKYHVSTSSIADANSLSGSVGDDIRPGTKLIIPISPNRHESSADAYSHKATHYKVRKGDTVASVADDFEVPVDKLRKWNHLRASSELTPGRMLVIYKPTSSDSSAATATAEGDPPESKTSTSGSAAHHSTTGKSHSSTTESAEAKYHTVKKGETLSSIAESNHVSVQALKRDNPKLAANLRAGDVLVIKK